MLIVRPKLFRISPKRSPNFTQISGEHLRYRRVRAAEWTRLEDVAGEQDGGVFGCRASTREGRRVRIGISMPWKWQRQT